MAKLRGAFIGFGNIAALGHWPSYAASSDIEMVAVMDSASARRDVALSLKPSLRAYTTVEDLLKQESLHFVDICTPPVSHASLALAALKQGVNVLCEKPLSLKPAEYAELAEAQKLSGKTVFTVHNWKYAPIVQKALSILKEGRIGPVWHAEIFTLRNSHCKGAPEGVVSGDDWRKDSGIAGGGILVDHGWHAFYLLLNLMGATPETVSSKMRYSADASASLEEAAQTLVQFPKADGYIHLTWHSPIRRNAMLLQGQNGALLLDDDRLMVSTQDGKKEEFQFPAALSAGSHHADWFSAMLPDFLREIRDPAHRGENFREAGWCLALTSAAYQSNLQGFKDVPVQFPAPSEPVVLA